MSILHIPSSFSRLNLAHFLRKRHAQAASTAPITAREHRPVRGAPSGHAVATAGTFPRLSMPSAFEKQRAKLEVLKGKLSVRYKEFNPKRSKSFWKD